MGMTYEQKIYEAKRNEIDIPKIVLEKRNLVGIYKFFIARKISLSVSMLENLPTLQIDFWVREMVISICIYIISLRNLSPI